MNNDRPTTTELVEISLRLLAGKDPLVEDDFNKALDHAVKYFNKAAVARTKIGGPHCYSPNYQTLNNLFAEKKIGKADGAQSVYETRISPRFPTEQELSKVQKLFSQQHSGEWVNGIESTLISVMKEAKIPTGRHPGTILAFCGHCRCREDIRGKRDYDSIELDWNEGSVERKIVRPASPPSVDDLADDITAAIYSYIEREHTAR